MTAPLLLVAYVAVAVLVLASCSLLWTDEPPADFGWRNVAAALALALLWPLALVAGVLVALLSLVTGGFYRFPSLPRPRLRSRTLALVLLGVLTLAACVLVAAWGRGWL